MNGRSPVLAVLGVLTLALASCMNTKSTPAASAAADSLVVLGDDLAPVREAFNAQSDRWRAFAVVSPTCSECVLGAEVVKREITDRHSIDKIAAIVVWIPMLPTDNESAAHKASAIFPAKRAEQFYDSKQGLGWEYARHTFGGFMQRARQATPDDDPLAPMLDEHAGDGGGPQWDLYMLYAPGVRWLAEAAPPMPAHWIRHCGRQDGETSTYWRDSPDTAPLRGDLYEAVRDMVNDAMRSKSALAIEILSSDDCPNAQQARETVESAVAALGLNAQVQCVNQDSLLVDDARRSWPSPTVLVDGQELFGARMPIGSSGACRAYPNGMPSQQEISDALHALGAR